MATVRKPHEEVSQFEKAQSTSLAPQTGPSREKIAARAYEIWRASGSPMGHDKEHWLQAERELRSGQPLKH